MADGMLVDPMQYAVADPLNYGAVPLPGQMQQRPQGFQGQGPETGGAPLNQIYGLLAQYGDDPAQVGQNYISAVQRQQQIDAFNDPMEQFMRLYGNINPFDFTPESLSRFHDNLVRTRQIDFDLLERKQTRIGEEMMNNAWTAANEAEMRSESMFDLGNRFSQAAAEGLVRGGVTTQVGGFLRGLVGGENEYDLLRKQYAGLMNSSVMANLPPGAASDADVALAKSGWPAGSEDPAWIASFLRGARKLALIDMAYETEVATYLATNQNMMGFGEHWNNVRNSRIERLFENHGLSWFVPPEGMSADEARNLAWQSYHQRAEPISDTAPGIRPATDDEKAAAIARARTRARGGN